MIQGKFFELLELAEALKLSKSMMYFLIRVGSLEVVKLGDTGKQILVPEEKLIKYLKESKRDIDPEFLVRNKVNIHNG